jgi:RsiW-degrading membrane proteinase PrsW (M82 family)
MIGRLALNLAIAALPAVVFVFGAAQRSELPFAAFYRSFAAGLLAVFPALAVMLLVSSAISGVGGLAGDALRAFVVAGLVEEVVKLAPVWWSMRQAGNTVFRGGRDSRARAAGFAAAGLEAPAPEQPPLLPLAVTAGLGFAFLENAFYLAGSFSSRGRCSPYRCTARPRPT